MTASSFFKQTGSLVCILAIVVSTSVFIALDQVGSLWWYLVLPPLVAITFIDLFTKVWFGISIFITLFLYCSIGSSGIPVSFAILKPETWLSLREIRALEMTEFEWFHWWPFKWLIALLCLNMSIVTVRKIPLNTLTLGVWTIHTGVIILVLGCLVYFTQKIEGDVLISRNRVVIEFPAEQPRSMVVTPNNSVRIGEFTCTVTNINPHWELMSGDDKGKVAYAVSISVVGPEASFVRQLIAGYPEYTEDVVQTGNPDQPMARAKNVLGKALVDDSIVMKLEKDPKTRFYVTQSASLYLRELNAQGVPITPWIERPIQDLPRFNDYISVKEDVWGAESPSFALDPLELVVDTAGTSDPTDQPIHITDYLRYSVLDSRIVSGGESLFPVAWLTLQQTGGASQSIKLFAFDPSANNADSNLINLLWLESEGALEALEKSHIPRLSATVDGESYDLQMTNEPAFNQIGDTGYAYRLQSVQNNLNINDTNVSLVVIELKHEDKEWVRWVFENKALTRDVVEDQQHAEDLLIDKNIQMTYSAGTAPITIAALPNGRVYLLTSDENVTKTQDINVGEQLQLTQDVSLRLDRIEAYAYVQTKPAIIPKSQREPSASNSFSMLKVIVGEKESGASAWLPYHHYPFGSLTESVHRFKYQPTMIQLSNGKLIEMMYSRSSAPLPAPVSLLDFEIDSHLGGFSGRTSSILNWRSIIEFNEGSENVLSVSVNDPQPHEGYWFFQSQWDPPSAASQGLNYTVLGVGNRRGVAVMLLGSCITVLGMIWAFVVKPTIKRKRQQAIYSGVSV